MAGPGSALDAADLYTFVYYSLKYTRVMCPVPAIPRETIVHAGHNFFDVFPATGIVLLTWLASGLWW